MRSNILGSSEWLSASACFLQLGLLLVVEHTEIAAPTDHLFRCHFRPQGGQGDAELLSDAELEQQPVVLGQLSL